MSVQEFADEDEGLTIIQNGNFRIAVGRNNSTGIAFLATSKQRVDFLPECAAHIAAALSQFERDNGERSFVADEWGPASDTDWDDPHPLREVYRTLVEMGLNESPMFARLEHVGDELRTLLFGLTLIANGHATPMRLAEYTLAEAARDRGYITEESK